MLALESELLPSAERLSTYLLHPMYLSTYQIDHVLELNSYVAWVLDLLARLIADPSPLQRVS